MSVKAEEQDKEFLDQMDAKPPPFAVQRIDELPAEMPPVVIEGLLRQLEIILIGGHSKSWKSWALLDLLFCVANGLPWLGLETIQGDVVHFDLELLGPDIRRRFDAIRDSHDESGESGSFEKLKIVSMRGKTFSLGDLYRIPEVLGEGVSLLSLDPSYRLLAGQDENAAGVIIDVMNKFLALGTELKSAVSLLQHFSKGNQSDKNAIDRFSGSGVWARHPDALVTFTEHEDDDCFTVAFTLRAFAPRESFAVRWQYPRFKIDSSLDPEKLKSPKSGRPKLSTADQLAGLLQSDESITYCDLRRRAEQVCAIPKRTFDRRLKDAKDRKLIYLSPLNGEYALTPSYVERHQSQNGNQPT